MHFTLPDGTRLDYDDTGEGPLAVYAHGAPLSREVEAGLGMFSWEPVERLPTHRFVRYDARGHGASTGRPNPADYRFDRFAKDLVALLGHLGGEAPVTGMGSSLGCATVLHAALQQPLLLDRLVLLIPPTAWETRPAQAVSCRKVADLVEQRGAEILTALTAATRVPPSLAGVPGYPPRECGVEGDLVPAVYRGLADSDLPDRDALAQLTQPALLLALADDPVHPLSTAQQLAAILPGARLHVSSDSADIATWGERIARFLTA